MTRMGWMINLNIFYFIEASIYFSQLLTKYSLKFKFTIIITYNSFGTKFEEHLVDVSWQM